MKRFRKTEQGFTLIELMIVIAIIGILAAIAIPQFAAYRVRSFNAAAVADLRNVATAQEAYYVDYQKYATGITVTATEGRTIDDLPGVVLSENVNLTVTGGADSYTITTDHERGSKIYSIDGPGGAIEDEDKP